mmetsp:Transcript_28381/g.69137  ORF Transcript_28381/g.69137 Transcript_28381/m.69137 type:complete len:201 (+) Transcript_28381:633-1235(+)
MTLALALALLLFLLFLLASPRVIQSKNVYFLLFRSFQRHLSWMGHRSGDRNCLNCLLGSAAILRSSSALSQKRGIAEVKASPHLYYQSICLFSSGQRLLCFAGPVPIKDKVPSPKRKFVLGCWGNVSVFIHLFVKLVFLVGASNGPVDKVGLRDPISLFVFTSTQHTFHEFFGFLSFVVFVKSTSLDDHSFHIPLIVRSL